MDFVVSIPQRGITGKSGYVSRGRINQGAHMEKTHYIQSNPPWLRKTARDLRETWLLALVMCPVFGRHSSGPTKWSLMQEESPCRYVQFIHLHTGLHLCGYPGRPLVSLDTVALCRPEQWCTAFLWDVSCSAPGRYHRSPSLGPGDYRLCQNQAQA